MSTRRARAAASAAARVLASAPVTNSPQVKPEPQPQQAQQQSKKRKQQPDQQPHQPDAVKQEAAVGASAPSSSSVKSNRRASKRAKLEAASAAAAEAAAKAQAASLRSKSVQQRARREAARREERSAEERELESFLFGGGEARGADTDEEGERDDEGEQEDARAQARAMLELEDQPADALFTIDTTGGGAGPAAPAGSAAEPNDSAAAPVKAAPAGPVPAWVDADDASSSHLVDLSSAARLRKLKSGIEERFITGAEYSRRLRQVYREMHPGAEAWAKAEQTDDKDLTQLLLQSSSTLAGSSTGGAGSSARAGGAGRGELLPSTSIDLVRMKDANLAAPNQSVVTVGKFHSHGQLFFTAGLDKMVRLFQIDGLTNAKLQGVWMEDLPVHSGAWLTAPASAYAGSSAELVVSGRRSFFYTVDIATGAVTKVPGVRGREERSLEKMATSPDGEYIAFLGNDGYVLLVSGRSKQLVGTLKLNLSVRALAFSADSQLLYATGGEGLVYVWETSSRKCLYKHVDHGSIAGSAIAVDQAGKGFYAVGQESGVVNLYNASQLSESLLGSSSTASASAVPSSASRFSSLSRPSPSPLKSFFNLTTPIDGLLFNADASLLLASSRRKKDALKLVHVQSQTVFQNWPTSSTPLHNVSCMDFSPNSGYMTIGNDRGRVLLYRLTHYPRA